MQSSSPVADTVYVNIICIKNSLTYAENDDSSRVRFPTDITSIEFRSQLKASRVSSHIEELGDNETVYLYDCIYMYIYSKKLGHIFMTKLFCSNSDFTNQKHHFAAEVLFKRITHKIKSLYSLNGQVVWSFFFIADHNAFSLRSLFRPSFTWFWGLLSCYFWCPSYRLTIAQGQL